jgi:hypothetical protein
VEKSQSHGLGRIPAPSPISLQDLAPPSRAALSADIAQDSFVSIVVGMDRKIESAMKGLETASVDPSLVYCSAATQSFFKYRCREYLTTMQRDLHRLREALPSISHRAGQDIGGSRSHEVDVISRLEVQLQGAERENEVVTRELKSAREERDSMLFEMQRVKNQYQLQCEELSVETDRRKEFEEHILQLTEKFQQLQHQHKMDLSERVSEGEHLKNTMMEEKLLQAMQQETSEGMYREQVHHLEQRIQSLEAELIVEQEKRFEVEKSMTEKQGTLEGERQNHREMIQTIRSSTEKALQESKFDLQDAKATIDRLQEKVAHHDELQKENELLNDRVRKEILEREIAQTQGSNLREEIKELRTAVEKQKVRFLGGTEEIALLEKALKEKNEKIFDMQYQIKALSDLRLSELTDIVKDPFAKMPEGDAPLVSEVTELMAAIAEQKKHEHPEVNELFWKRSALTLEQQQQKGDPSSFQSKLSSKNHSAPSKARVRFTGNIP